MMKHLRTLTLAALTPLSPLAAQDTVTDFDQWYPFEPSEAMVDGPLSLTDWFDGRAGEQGRIRMMDDKLIYDDEPFAVWGVNITYGSIAPERELADRRADWYQHIGINSVRLHKYADGGQWAGIMSDESITEFNPEKLDRMDYFIATLAEHGIYTKLSPNFGVKIQPDDRHRIPWFDEIGKNGKRVDADHGAIYLSRELQDIQIEIIVNTLNHTNPYTGRRYADDPAIWCVEMFNEDAVLFYGTNTRLQQLPTLRARNAKLFSAWLTQKYGGEAAWREAWGTEAIYGGDEWSNPQLESLVKPGRVKGDIPAEGLTAGTVVPWGQPWFYDNALADGDDPVRALRQRMVDTMNFLTEQMDAFHARFLSAIRDTGYSGIVMAGNWQTGNNVSHYHNLHSDYKIGLIDRHNYFRGPRHALRRSNMDLNKRSMMNPPGSSILSSGMQQVADRPFMISEWIHEQPSEWLVEGPAIIGAYGMGLNGWDASYIFQNKDDARFSTRMGTDAWDVMLPQVAGSFFAISRQVLRGDVAESPVTVPLKVHPESLREGVSTASFRTVQEHDVKSFDTDEVPSETMAVARVAVEFTERPEETKSFDLYEYEKEGALVSTTDQLRWYYNDEASGISDGYFTMDTPATVAFAGFAPGDKTFPLGGFQIQPEEGFSTIYITALGEDETFRSGGDLLIQAIARGRNADVRYNEDETRLLEVGRGPLLLEPVEATVTVDAQVPFKVEKLTHDGALTGEFIPVSGRSFRIDGARDKTPYYLLRWQP